jgi:hypothetical protein
LAPDSGGRYDRLSWDNEPSRKTLDNHSRQIGRRGRGSNRINLFAERVDQPTDNENSRCFAIAADATFHRLLRKERPVVIGPGAPLSPQRRGRRPSPPKSQLGRDNNELSRLLCPWNKSPLQLTAWALSARPDSQYDVSNSVLAAEEWQRLYPDERCDLLEDAKRSAQPGTRPVITNDLLAAIAGEQSAAI